jgi:hypothetical protein
LTRETQFGIEDKGESTTVMRERRIRYELGESILEEMEKFCTLSQKEHQSNSISDLFNKLRHNIYRIACESDFKLREVKGSPGDGRGAAEDLHGDGGQDQNQLGDRGNKREGQGVAEGFHGEGREALS